MQLPKSPVFSVLAGILSWLGRQGTRAIAALVIIGIALPPIGSLLKPYVTEAVFILLSIAFLRMDIVGLKACLRRPIMVLAATVITLSPRKALLPNHPHL